MMEYVILVLLMVPPLLLAAYRTWRIRGEEPLDLGLLFAGIVFIYAWLPLLGLILAQHGYGTLQDMRVMNDVPTSGEVVFVGANYLAFLFCFTLVYGWQRKVVPASPIPVSGNGFQVLVAVVVTALVFSANFLGRLWLGIEEAKNYGESYTQILHFPKVVQQVMNNLAQIEFSACLALVVFIIAWKPHLHRYVALAVAGLLACSVFSGGSRTFGFLLAFAYVVCFSVYVRSLKAIHLLLVAGVGLALFTFAGMVRAGAGFDAFMLTPFQGGEFFSLFINSVDLLRQSAETGGMEVPWQLHWVDLLRFIPQQLLGIEKVDPAVWYVGTYYQQYYKIGGGLAFGAIAESVVGFGIAEAVVRGGLLGWAYAFVANRCISDRMTSFKVFIYIWFVVMSYQAVRDTTFSLFSRFVFQMVPVLFLVAMANRLRERRIEVVNTNQQRG